MTNRLGLWVTSWLLLGFAVAAGAQPADVKPPANDDCLACHSDPDGKRADGTAIFVDTKSFGESAHGPMACVDCHRDLAKHTEYPHADKLAPAACASCHAEVASEYHDSIHNWAIEKAGLNVAPTCADCHGKHDIKLKSDASSRVFRSNVPATCGSCHEGVAAHYNASVHGVSLAKGAAAPICTDCHTAHQIKRADTPAWRLSVTAECGSCHTDVVDSFRRTFHGKVTELGFTRVAACADCHSAHDILPASNAASTVSPGHLVETCGKCHQGANARFVKYDPHPNPRDYDRSPVLWWLRQFYIVLIAGCFSLFGVHSALWYRREHIERTKHAANGKDGAES